jgi:hypothetical protein
MKDTCGSMCFSAEADFAVAAVVAPVGVATLRAARRRPDLVLAALPLMLALHQLAEGVVWLGLEGNASRGLQDAATHAYLAFAQVVLPVIVPLGILLTEPDRRRRAWMAALLAGGAVVAARFAWILISNPVGAQALDHVIIYDTDWEFGYVVAAGYVLVTCGPALMASSRPLRWFGVASLAGLLLASGVRYSAVTSIWCVYAALISVLVLLHFRDVARRWHDAQPRWTSSAPTDAGSRHSPTGATAAAVPSRAAAGWRAGARASWLERGSRAMRRRRSRRS